MADTKAKTDAAAKAQAALAAKRDATKKLYAEIDAAAKAGTLASKLINEPITDGKQVVADLNAALSTVQELIAKLEAVAVGRLEMLAIRIRCVAYRLPPKSAGLDDMKKIRKMLADAKKSAAKLVTAVASISTSMTGNAGVMKQIEIAAKQYELLMKDASPEERAS